MNINNHYPVQKRVDFQTDIRKYYETSCILICRSTVPNGLAASFKLLGNSEVSSIGGHGHDGNFNNCNDISKLKI